MSEEGSPEITKSWVFLDSPDEVDNGTKDTSGIQEVTDNEPHLDSDTDSISVISESGCSYKTDEEEFSPPDAVENAEDVLEESEIHENELEIIKEKREIDQEEFENITEWENLTEPENINPQLAPLPDENKAIETLLYFATSAVCAIILVGFSIAVQHYFQGTSDVNNFDPDQQFAFRSQNLKNDDSPNKFNPKRKNHLNVEDTAKVAKIQKEEFHDKMIDSVGDNDLRVEGNFKSIYKLNKNKNAATKCNKENCEVNENRPKNYPPDATDKNNGEKPPDETYNKKVKELRIKEDYLKEKEKFLIEKEHNLMKQEIKLNREKHTRNKHDKKTYDKKRKEYDDDSSEEDNSDEKKNIKDQSKKQAKNNKKHNYKEEKKQTQNRFKYSDEQDKRRNVSGHWYINLHEARDHMRQKKRSSFKRNKAHWYFQWMVDRARLRVK